MDSYDAMKKVRKVWKIKPVEKIKPSAKKYDRRDAEREIEKQIREDLEDEGMYDEYGI